MNLDVTGETYEDHSEVKWTVICLQGAWRNGKVSVSSKSAQW